MEPSRHEKMRSIARRRLDTLSRMAWDRRSEPAILMAVESSLGWRRKAPSAAALRRKLAHPAPRRTPDELDWAALWLAQHRPVAVALCSDLLTSQQALQLAELALDHDLEPLLAVIDSACIDPPGTARESAARWGRPTARPTSVPLWSRWLRWVAALSCLSLRQQRLALRLAARLGAEAFLHDAPLHASLGPDLEDWLPAAVLRGLPQLVCGEDAESIAAVVEALTTAHPTLERLTLVEILLHLSHPRWAVRGPAWAEVGSVLQDPALAGWILDLLREERWPVQARVKARLDACYRLLCSHLSCPHRRAALLALAPQIDAELSFRGAHDRSPAQGALRWVVPAVGWCLAGLAPTDAAQLGRTLELSPSDRQTARLAAMLRDEEDRFALMTLQSLVAPLVPSSWRALLELLEEEEGALARRLFAVARTLLGNARVDFWRLALTSPGAVQRLLVPAQQVAPPWLSAYPQELAAALGVLAALTPEAEALAADRLAELLPSQESKQQEIEYLEALATPTVSQSVRLAALLARQYAPRGPSRRTLTRLCGSLIDLVLAHAERAQVRLDAETWLQEYGALSLLPWATTELGHRLLRGLREQVEQPLVHQLLAARSGPPAWDLRDAAPNREFLERLRSQGVDSAPWLGGFALSMTVAGQVMEFALATDPLDALALGAHFSTCLAPDEDRFASALACAVDLNKRVLYVREQGRVRARCVLALTREGALVSYRAYVKGGLPVEAALRRYLHALACCMGTTVAAGGDVDYLLSGAGYGEAVVDRSGALEPGAAGDLQEPPAPHSPRDEHRRQPQASAETRNRQPFPPPPVPPATQGRRPVIREDCMLAPLAVALAPVRTVRAA